MIGKIGRVDGIGFMAPVPHNLRRSKGLGLLRKAFKGFPHDLRIVRGPFDRLILFLTVAGHFLPRLSPFPVSRADKFMALNDIFMAIFNGKLP